MLQPKADYSLDLDHGSSLNSQSEQWQCWYQRLKVTSEPRRLSPDRPMSTGFKSSGYDDHIGFNRVFKHPLRNKGTISVSTMFLLFY